MGLTIFGPGVLFVRRTDIANQTPVNIGKITEFSLDESVEVKPLYGQDNYPLAVASGQVKSKGKMKPAVLSANALNAVFYGITPATGSTILVPAESATVPASSTYTCTVANGATFAADLGVTYASTGLPLKLVTSLTAAGQYMVNTTTGVYTFFSGDASASLKIAYTYTSNAATTQTVSVVAKPIGQTVTFEIYYATTDSAGVPYFVRVYQAVSEKLSQGFKMSDWKTQEIDFDFFQNAAGKVVDYSYGNIS
jgi:hypothetical protein